VRHPPESPWIGLVLVGVTDEVAAFEAQWRLEEAPSPSRSTWIRAAERRLEMFPAPSLRIGHTAPFPAQFAIREAIE
jgi:hypothetical protein